MDASKDCYVVPLYNLDVEMTSTSFGNETALKDDDCCIVEPSTSQESGTSHIHSVYSLNVEYKEKNIGTNHMETCVHESPSTVIDVDSDKDNDCMIIDSTDSKDNHSKQSRNNSMSHDKNVIVYDDIYKENPLLAELIEKCLVMENSDGMLRVINRTLIPLYNDVSETFKKSNHFHKMLMLISRRLDIEPDKKFSHIKTLCEELKISKEKKRGSLITLKKNLNGKFSTKKTKSCNKLSQKRKKVDVINLDDYDDVLIDCSSDTSTNDVTKQIVSEKSSLQAVDNIETDVSANDTENDSDVQIECGKIDDDVILIEEKKNSNKENRDKTGNSAVSCNTLFPKRRKEIHNSIDIAPSEINLYDKNDIIDKTTKDLNRLRPPTDTILNPQSHSERIAYLERQIALNNSVIKDLDEAEVTDDGNRSPYLRSEYFKSKVVSLYKELCELTGSASVKHHKVRLKVAPGYSEGPVRCLQEFINSNIDENGNPPFPDLHDVISCVNKANRLYNMGMNKNQIQNEARALFVHYGRTVQRIRQKREWKHLLTYVKEEAPDPADYDPLLEARLQENAKVAKKNEKDVLDRYAQMEYHDALPDPEMRSGLEVGSESERDSDNDSSPNDVPNNEKNTVSLNSHSDICDRNITDNIVMYNPWSERVQIVATSITNTEFNNTGSNQNMVTPMYIITRMDPNTGVLMNIPELSISVANQNKVLNSSTTNAIQINEVTTNLVEPKTVSNDSEDKVTEMVKDIPPNTEIIGNDGNNTCNIENSNAEVSQTDLKNAIVKKEPLDTAYLLQQLGDNYTATIIDIEDPFLVIEISDSSDSEEDQ